jgi:hypothetical protein
MHRTTRSARPAAALALALAAALVVPGAAIAVTTDPTTDPAPATTSAPTTTAPTTTAPATTAPSATTTADPTGTTSTGDTATTTGTPTTPATSATTATTGSASSTTAPSTTSAPARNAPAKSPAKRQASSSATVTFDAANGASPARLSGSTAEQAGYAAGFMVRTLTSNEDHYNYPGGKYFDGGNTIDAILGLDGAKVGKAEADAAFAYLGNNLALYNGGDPKTGLYAGSTGKALIAVVAHGGDPRAFGGQDLLDLLSQSLGAAEPGRYSDLPATGCGYDPCDYSNTIGQALDIIGVGRATGSAPQEAVDYLLAQQCADGGFRGELAAAGGTCTSDIDATAFAVQAVIGLRGTVDPAVTRALTFLAGKQASNGGFLNGDGQYNANTAGVAAQAFAAGGRSAELALAQGFLASLQMDCAFASGLRGGIAFTAADRSTLASTPGDTAALDRALRATPQATLGLAGGTLLSVGSDGATSAVPAPSCPTTSTSTTSTTTATTGVPTGSAPGTSAAAAPAGTPGEAPAASATPGALAFTGADVAMTALAGLVLLLVGAAALVLARRKGAHA